MEGAGGAQLPPPPGILQKRKKTMCNPKIPGSAPELAARTPLFQEFEEYAHGLGGCIDSV